MPPRFDRRRRHPPMCHRSRVAVLPRGGCHRAVAGVARARMAWPVAQQRLAGWRRGAFSAPTRLTVPMSVLRSITISPRSSSRTRPIGPSSSASGPTWPDGGAGREPGEPAVGNQRHVFSPRQVTECSRDLRGLLHAGPGRPHADQHNDVTRAPLVDVPFTAWIASRSSLNTAPDRDDDTRHQRQSPTNRSRWP